MSKINELNAQNALDQAGQTTDPKKKFCILWNGSIRPVLEVIKKITGPKVDAQINDLEKACDQVCSGDNPDVANFCNAWKSLHLESVLRLVETFTGRKVKAVINEFINIADSLCPDAPVTDNTKTK